MRTGIVVGSILKVKHQGEVVDAKVRRIGSPTRDGDRGIHAWAMLTLDINGECAYTVAREDELAVV